MESESEKKRAERKRQRELKDARKKELSEATSSSERRKIKAKYSEPKANVNEGGSEGNSYDSMSGRTEQPMPTMSEREAASGLYDTTVGRDSFYDSDIEPSAPESPSEQVLYPDDGGGGSGGNSRTLTICENGQPAEVTFLIA
jgi:hypothetical protein